MTIVLGKFGNPGPGFFLVKSELCCEEAEALAGIPGACSGNNSGGNTTDAGKIGYIGCFKDTSDYDLGGFLERSRSNTPERCIATCRAKGFKYAAVQFGESCLCGDSYGKYGAASNCDYPCTGDGDKIAAATMPITFTQRVLTVKKKAAARTLVAAKTVARIAPACRLYFALSKARVLRRGLAGNV